MTAMMWMLNIRRRYDAWTATSPWVKQIMGLIVAPGLGSSSDHESQVLPGHDTVNPS